MGNGMNKVVDGLYLGNIRDSENRESLSQNNITHILSVYNNAKPVLEDMTYLCIHAADVSSQNLSQHFKESIRFIHECRLNGGACLVHCLAGVSRSTTMVVAYLMTVTTYSWEECLSAVKAVRSFVGPNYGFQQQLQEYQMNQVTEMSVNPGGRRLKQWLVEQIQSGQYPGLLWEDDSRTMFRIPWKHAGKQDYNQEVDASIFKAWAVFKGKFKEGEKAEPATWKTRLRCALNKSPDFEEVGDRSQLDISEPYKVYRIVPEEEQKTGKSAAAALTSSPGDITDMDCSSAHLEELIKESSSDEYLGIVKRSHSPQEDGCRMQPSPEYWSQGSASVFPGHQDPSPIGSFNAAFSQMIINFFYGGKLMDSVVTSHADGCRISPGQPPLVQHRSPYCLPDSLQNVRFPPAELIEVERQRHVTRKLLGHLERGVLVRANREGIFIKRLCQSRVFWSGQGELGPHYSPGGPCKLERDAVVKIFDTGRFFEALQLYQEGQLPAPDPMVTLCFGEELHDLSTAKSKLIIIQVTPVNCQQLLDAVSMRRSQYSSPNLEIQSDELQAGEQMARIYQDLCSYTAPQRAACYRDNMPITA